MVFPDAFELTGKPTQKKAAPRLPAIKERLKQIPDKPGVYLMKDARGNIIYIGKAVRLRTRVSSYFNASRARNHLASHILQDKVADVEWIVTDNEMEALILEANLVKKNAPRYNIMLKDDKHYPYLCLTVSEPYPRVIVTRNRSRGKDVYFGPFTEVRAMRRTIRLLHKVFRIRDCDLDLPLKKKIQPCLTYHIGRCDAPCAELCGEEEYRPLVKQAELLLRGRNTELLKTLSGEMNRLALREQYERAAKVRDQMRNIESVLQKQKMDLGDAAPATDIVAVARDGRVGGVVVLSIREGIVTDRKRFTLHCPLEQSEPELCEEFLLNYYREQPVPSEILLSHPLQDEAVFIQWLSREAAGEVGVSEQEAATGAPKGSRSRNPVKIHVPQRGGKKKQVHLAVENAKLYVAEKIHEGERRNRINYMVSTLQEDLHLAGPPRRMEAFDISHLGGTDTVASQVVFEDGKPKKSAYRKYNVKTVRGIDDFASMEEVLTRRLKRIQNQEDEAPDLILIDGGKGQLSAAVKVRESMGLSVPMIGLAKRLEEVFIPGRSEPAGIPKTSASLRLLQQLRDEAHRFAVTFQKSKRGKYLKKSWLDEVPGVGPKTVQDLIRAFGSPLAVKNKTRTELAEVVGPHRAQKIAEFKGK